MTQILTPADVQLHNTKEDLYMIINNIVYDATSFVEEHPGGYDVLLEVAGQDATESYIATDHSEEADDILSDLKIGTLDLSVKPTDVKNAVKIDTVEIQPEVIEGIEPPPAVLTQAPAKEDVNVDTIRILKPDIFQEFKLEKKTEISHNVAIYRFTLPSPTSTFGLPIGQHISIGAFLPQPDGSTKEVVRSYTPISGDHQPGFFDLLIKTYPGGAITQHVSALNIGDVIRVRGPKGAFMYTPNMVRRFGMIAGGTGITPMLQIVNAIRRGRAQGDKTQIDLIFANVDEQDILLKEELDALVREDEGIRVNYVLNNPPEGWTSGVGFVSKEMIEKWLPPPASDVKILLCGPPPMVGAMKKITESLGYEKARPVSKLEDQVFAF
ncbi:NADH-cytochrome b5 reductase [Didymosphaeria variabile]|uniref:NADH-cytochrome b5 reductase 1 n=1 Tax=Didymosphaeria variabile TaxID=1932322 RepID=A0A9W8XBJ0_9PLEO|nr:NADH-cytochrome b5 reductase [Didymosphaeria variabile]KAJ4346644.1 NADH-cytochrome b5 reductase [Didymosphaeria variabile]